MIDKAKETTAEEQAFASHCDYCPLGCGIDYEKGRCAEGDRLAEAMTVEFSVGDVVLEDHYGACVVERGPGYGGVLSVRVLSSGKTLRQHQSWFKPAPDAITALGWLA